MRTRLLSLQLGTLTLSVVLLVCEDCVIAMDHPGSFTL